MTEIKISDEDVAVVGFALCERASLPACDKLCEDCADDGRAVLQALVASGWRRETDVLREAADEIERDGGSVLTALWAADALREKATTRRSSCG
jgi:hypothetical protein